MKRLFVWGISACMLAGAEPAVSVYQIKYEPVTRQCDLFIGLEYVAHFDMQPQDEGCEFILPRQVGRCELLQSRNAKRTHIERNVITLEYDKRRKVAFNTYDCQY